MNTETWKFVNKQNKTSTQVIGWATHLQDEYWRVAQCLKSRSTTTTITNQQISISWDLVKWEKPTTRRYKCNINASFSSSLNIADLRICIRDDYDDDDDGDFVLAKNSLVSPSLWYWGGRDIWFTQSVRIGFRPSVWQRRFCSRL